MMALTSCEKKQMISELQKINDEQENNDKQEINNEFMLIDFMRKYFSHDDYADLFNKEREEKIKIKQNDYDIRKFTFNYLQRYIPTKYNIGCDYVNIKNIKVIIFYEHIMKYLENNNNENEEKNKKIKENKEIYKLFKALISKEKCDLSKYPTAIEKLGMTSETQKKLDDDEYNMMHENYANFICDTILMKYIDEYKNYLCN